MQFHTAISPLTPAPAPRQVLLRRTRKRHYVWDANLPEPAVPDVPGDVRGHLEDAEIGLAVPEAPKPPPPPPPRAQPTPLRSSAVRVKYGREFGPGVNDLTIELLMFRELVGRRETGDQAFEHLKRIIDILWNRPKSRATVDWTAWAELMLRNACRCDSLAVAGCAGSGKSHIFAVWAIVQYLCSPSDTTVIVTSTTAREARRRIWKSVEHYWTGAPELPGKLTSSQIHVKGVSTSGKLWEGSGIVFIPSEKSAERDSLAKLQGLHNERVIYVADEAAELSDAMYDAARTNLTQNPFFHMTGLANPVGYTDSFARMAEPVGGYGSISIEDDVWETKNGGLAVHLDGERSPNVIAGEVLYRYLPKPEKLKQMRDEHGKDSRYYYRMGRGFWVPEGIERGFYDEATLAFGSAARRVTFRGDTITVAGLDLSFSSTGDQCKLAIGRLGIEESSSLRVLQLDRIVSIKENLKDELPRAYQIVRQVIKLCEENGIASYHLAVDATSAGGPYCDILAAEWFANFSRVNSQESPSELPISGSDPRPSKERYADKATELWLAGAELVRSKQLCGITPEVAAQLTARQEHDKPVSGGRIKIESKVDFRKRMNYSPDAADAVMLMVDLCRSRLGLVSTEHFAGAQGRIDAFKKHLKQVDEIQLADFSMAPAGFEPMVFADPQSFF